MVCTVLADSMPPGLTRQKDAIFEGDACSATRHALQVTSSTFDSAAGRPRLNTVFRLFCIHCKFAWGPLTSGNTLSGGHRKAQDAQRHVTRSKRRQAACDTGMHR
jgi:hypothetical protein